MPYSPSATGAAIVTKIGANLADSGSSALQTSVAGGNTGPGAFVDGLLSGVGYKAYDAQGATGTSTNATTTFANITAFPNYTFNAPIASTYIVHVSAQCFMTVAADAVYFKLVNTTTGLSYDDASMRIFLSVNVSTDKRFSVPVAMAAGNNVLQLHWKVRDGSGTVKVTVAGAGDTAFRSYLITG